MKVILSVTKEIIGNKRRLIICVYPTGKPCKRRNMDLIKRQKIRSKDQSGNHCSHKILYIISDEPIEYFEFN